MHWTTEAYVSKFIQLFQKDIALQSSSQTVATTVENYPVTLQLCVRFKLQLILFIGICLFVVVFCLLCLFYHLLLLGIHYFSHDRKKIIP